MRTVESEIGAVLAGSISEITQRSIFRRLGGVARTPLQQLSVQERQAVQAQLESSVRLFAPARSVQLIASCARVLALLGPAATGSGAAPADGDADQAAPAVPAAMDRTLPIESEKDIASARLEAWSEAVRIGLSKFTSVKVATAVSELARNIVFYAGRGSIELRARHDLRETRLEIVASDRGSGIAPDKLDAIFAGTYRSERGMGKGLVAVQKLVDEFRIDTRPGEGTRVSCVFRAGRSTA
jgi:anti-sigma regulatory factor (Ser/Thr protein kinase)